MITVSKIAAIFASAVAVDAAASRRGSWGGRGWGRGPSWNQIRPTREAALDAACPTSEIARPVSVRFNDGDDLACRSEVEFLTSNYRESYQGFLDSEEHQCNWNQLILSALRIKDVQLVDNQDFLAYMRTEVNNISFGYEYLDTECGPDAGELDEDLKALLLTEHGASTLDTVESLQEALRGLFYYRGFEFEAIAMFDEYPAPMTEGCSEVTQEAVYEVYYDLVDAQSIDLDLINLRPFYQFVLNWIMDQ